MALLHITDAGGRQWECPLTPQALCTIGRAPDNTVVLNDPRASRYHAHVKFQDGQFILIDGRVGGGRSANHVFVGGEQRFEHTLRPGDRVTIGASLLIFEREVEQESSHVRYDDKPLGHTQLLVSANDVIRSALAARTTTSGSHLAASPAAAAAAANEELEALRGKAKILALLYDMSKMLGSVFSLEAIFDKATQVIFDATPADRVVALLTNEDISTRELDNDDMKVVALRVRDPRREAQAQSQTIGRTITRKAMRERVALLSQDAASDAEFQGVHSIVSQGVRSTICAPLIAESGVHGALYADRLDPLTSFTRDHLELVSAVAAQAAAAVENARAHEQLAREEVARANYSRFMPEHVVQQILDHPDSFKLGGTNQNVTALFADIRGFTRLSEHAPPDKVVRLLNYYFTEMSEVVFAHGGTLDKYIGDGLLALFGAPTASPEDACNAVTAAIAMQRRMAVINERLRGEGLAEISVGIGMNTGVATVGYIGSDRRSEYTAIGDTINLAARLEQNAQGGQILVSEATAVAATAASCTFNPLTPPIVVKNRVQPVPIFEVEWRDKVHETDVP